MAWVIRLRIAAIVVNSNTLWHHPPVEDDVHDAEPGCELDSIAWDAAALSEAITVWETLESELLALPIADQWKGRARVERGPARRIPPLSERQVSEFERRFGVSLPEDYRWFITSVANGHEAGHGVLFPLSAANDDPTHLGAARPRNPSSDQYWSGTLGIGDVGCAQSARLTVTGADPGSVWIDGRSGAGRDYDFGGERAITFRRYYTTELTRVIERLRGQVDNPVPTGPPFSDN